jgi:hypothetical protein
MIYAIVVFVATGLPPQTLRSAETFGTLAECQVALAAEMPVLNRARAATEAKIGRPVRLVAMCVRSGPEGVGI